MERNRFNLLMNLFNNSLVSFVSELQGGGENVCVRVHDNTQQKIAFPTNQFVSNDCV